MVRSFHKSILPLSLVVIFVAMVAATGLVGAASYDLDTLLVSHKGDPATADLVDESEDVAISEDGQWVAFESSASDFPGITDTNTEDDIYLLNTQTNVTIRVSDAGTEASPLEADAGSYDPEISSDGRYVVFESSATNLVAGVTSGDEQIYVFDRVNHAIEHVSRGRHQR